MLPANNEVTVAAPFGLEPGTNINLQLWYFGIPSGKIPLSLVSAAPALFTRDRSGTGAVSVTNEDGTADAPSPPGSVITLTGTGGGLVTGAVDGALKRSTQKLAGSVQVTIGGRQAEVLSAGVMPQLPNGIFQIKARVPAGASSSRRLFGCPSMANRALRE